MYDSLPPMLWSAAYAIAALRQQVETSNNISDRQFLYIQLKASEEIADSADLYLYGG